MICPIQIEDESKDGDSQEGISQINNRCLWCWVHFWQKNEKKGNFLCSKMAGLFDKVDDMGAEIEFH
jgi:hypothetical protein